MLGIINTLVNVARGAWRFLAGIPGDIGNALQGLWNFARSVQQVIDYVLSHPLSELLNAIAIFTATVTGNHLALVNAIERIDPWINRNRIIPLRAQVLTWFAQLRARIAYLFAQAYLYINLKFRQAEKYALALVRAEHADMLKHFTAAEQYAYAQALMRYQAIEHEAADTYNSHLKDRLGLVQVLADLAATRNPVVQALVKDLVTGVIDLAGAEDPLARLALGFLVRELVNHLAVDRPVAALLQDLLGPLLGRPRARGVADVVGDLEDRVDAIEQWQATFMADGGPEILQAGEDWADMTTLLTDAALLAFLGSTVIDPAAAAAEVNRVLVPVADGAATAWRDLVTRT